ncbi:MAG TPA: response regulator transcription factor [Acidimicrobiales bacterium]|nr:response regulator transcription factor [Acidimicrobiales bacterium]
MARVLVVDDDPSLLRALRLGLEAGGHEVTTADTGQEGLAMAATSSPEVVVLDLGLPDIDGLEVGRRIRGFSEVPIIVLSAHGAEDRKVAALDGGADDYVTKPFSLPELEARVRAAIRARASASPDQPTELQSAGFVIDLVHHEVRRGAEPVALTGKEFDVLAFLVRHAGRTCTHQMILGAVWGPGYREEASYVHAYVHRLRVKLDDESGELIETVPGVGYRWAGDLSDDPKSRPVG